MPVRPSRNETKDNQTLGPEIIEQCAPLIYIYERLWHQMRSEKQPERKITAKTKLNIFYATLTPEQQEALAMYYSNKNKHRGQNLVQGIDAAAQITRPVADAAIGATRWAAGHLFDATVAGGKKVFGEVFGSRSTKNNKQVDTAA